MALMNRRFRHHIDGEGIAISEERAYLPLGYKRRRWDQYSVWITKHELAELAKVYLTEGQPA